MNKVFAKPLFPIFGVVFLVLLYGFFDQTVIHCVFKGCTGIDAKTAFDLPTKTASFEELRSKLDANEVKLREQLVSVVVDDNKFQTEIKSLRETSAAIRQEMVSRYSLRYIWTFLTALFFLLCIGAIGLTVVIFKASSVQTSRWIFRTSLFGGLFGLLLLVFPGIYMQILEDLYRFTVFSGLELPKVLLEISNAFGFVATVFLVAAVSAILYSVKEKKSIEEQHITKFHEEKESGNHHRNVEKDAAAASVPLAEKYETQLKNLKYVLYMGSAILFVAVLQLKTLSDWHLAFMPTESVPALAAIYKTFFTSSITFQAGLYTIMLGLLYLPAAFVIQEKAAALVPTGGIGNTELSEKGLSFSFWNFLPRLLTILSPFIAGPAVELTKYLSGT